LRDQDAVSRHMAQAVKVLRQALELRPDDSETHALLSTVYGLQIADSPASALWRGPKVLRHRRLALASNPRNPRMYYLQGMSAFHAPGFFGGEKKALDLLLKAEALFEDPPSGPRDPIAPTWGYDNCLVFIGACYLELGDTNAAEAYYGKALSVNPRHGIAAEGLQRCRTKRPNE